VNQILDTHYWSHLIVASSHWNRQVSRRIPSVTYGHHWPLEVYEGDCYFNEDATGNEEFGLQDNIFHDWSFPILWTSNDAHIKSSIPSQVSQQHWRAKRLKSKYFFTGNQCLSFGICWNLQITVILYKFYYHLKSKQDDMTLICFLKISTDIQRRVRLLPSTKCSSINKIRALEHFLLALEI
jgi:hypothetical protein